MAQIEEKNRKKKTGKVVYRKRKRQKRIRSEKTEINKDIVSFREYITTKKRRKKTTELRSARYICAREISSRDPRE